MYQASHRGSIVLIATLLLVGSLVYGLEIRTPTVNEVLAQPWEPGTVRVAGTVASSQPWPTTQGDRVAIDLEESPWSFLNGGHLLADVGTPKTPELLLDTADASHGERIRATLHFREFQFNGMPAVAAPEAPSVFPGLWHAISAVVDALSDVGGHRLVPLNDGHGLEVRSLTGNNPPLEDLRIAWARGDHPTTAIEQARSHLTVGGRTIGPHGELSEHDSGDRLDHVEDYILAAAGTFVQVSDGLAHEDGAALASGPQHVYDDVDQDGRMSDGDRIWLQGAAGEGEVNSWLVSIGHACAPQFHCPSVATGFFLADHDGWNHWRDATTEPQVWRVAPDNETRVQLLAGEAMPLEWVQQGFLETPEGSTRFQRPMPSNVTVQAMDVDGDGRFGPGDHLLARAPHGQPMAWNFIDEERQTMMGVAWRQGLAPMTQLNPEVRAVADEQGWLVKTAFPHDGLDLRYVWAEVNGTKMALSDGATVGPLRFHDDGDGILSDGDRFDWAQQRQDVDVVVRGWKAHMSLRYAAE